jgi:hypothetical protein
MLNLITCLALNIVGYGIKFKFMSCTTLFYEQNHVIAGTSEKEVSIIYRMHVLCFAHLPRVQELPV